MLCKFKTVPLNFNYSQEQIINLLKSLGYKYDYINNCYLCYKSEWRRLYFGEVFIYSEHNKWYISGADIQINKFLKK
jgi:hypothetical protein